LFEDSKLNLWESLGEGLLRYERNLDEFVSYAFLNSVNDTISYVVTTQAEANDSTVWAWIRHTGLFKVDMNHPGLFPMMELIIGIWVIRTTKCRR
jgi:hypothetical protein